MSKNRFTCPDGTDIKLNKLVGVSPLIINHTECSFKLYMENVIMPIDIMLPVRRSESFDAKVFKDCILFKGQAGTFKYVFPANPTIESVWIDALELCAKAFSPSIDIVTVSICQLIAVGEMMAEDIASISDKTKSLSVVGKAMTEARDKLVGHL